MAHPELDSATILPLAAHHGRTESEVQELLEGLTEDNVLMKTENGWKRGDIAPDFLKRMAKAGQNRAPRCTGRHAERSGGNRAPNPGGNQANPGGNRATPLSQGVENPPEVLEKNGGTSPSSVVEASRTPATSPKRAGLGVPPSLAAEGARPSPSRPGAERTEKGTAVPPNPSSFPAVAAPRVVGQKLDGGSALALKCTPSEELLGLPPGDKEYEGENFKVSHDNYNVSLIHREATLLIHKDGVKLTASKIGLRELGELVWLERWVDLATQIVLGRACSLDEADSLGWSIRNLELALDVVELPLPTCLTDFSMVSPDSPTATTAVGGRPVWIRLTPTLRPRNGISVVLQDKSQWALSRKGGSTKKRPRELFDHPVEGPDLQAHGLQRGEKVTRVEAHLDGLALSLHDKDTGEEIYDMRSPRSWDDPEARRRFWSWFLRARLRFAVPGDGLAAERATRPEWESLVSQVSSPSDPPAPERLQRARKNTRRLTAEEGLERALKRKCRAERDEEAARARIALNAVDDDAPAFVPRVIKAVPPAPLTEPAPVAAAVGACDTAQPVRPLSASQRAPHLRLIPGGAAPPPVKAR